MLRSDLIILIGTGNCGKDVHGFALPPIESRTTVYGDQKSVGMSEFYKAAQIGIATDLKFTVNADEYAGQQYAEHGGRRYKVVRSYTRGDETELILSDITEKKGDDRNG